MNRNDSYGAVVPPQQQGSAGGGVPAEMVVPTTTSSTTSSTAQQQHQQQQQQPSTEDTIAALPPISPQPPRHTAAGLGGGGMMGGGSGAGMMMTAPSSAPSSTQQPQASSASTSPYRPSSSGSSPGKRKSYLMNRGALDPSAFRAELPLLEEVSFHQSVHPQHRGKPGWVCRGCNNENVSALSKECSVCGMERSLSQLMESPDVSEFCEDSVSSFGGEVSTSSLFQNLEGGGMNDSIANIDELQNSISEIVECRSVTGRFAASMPAINAPQLFPDDQSISSTRSFMSTRTAAATRHHQQQRRNRRQQRRQQQGGGGANNNNGGADADGNDDSDAMSVLSFSTGWDGNGRLESWTCRHCTYKNENSLVLACEMCGNNRFGNNNNNTTANTANSEVAAAAAAEGGGGPDVVPADDGTAVAAGQPQPLTPVGDGKPPSAAAAAGIPIASPTLSTTSSSAHSSSAFETSKMRSEISKIDDDEYGENEEQIELLIAQQHEILMGFQQNRMMAESSDHRKQPPQVPSSYAAPLSPLSVSTTATTSSTAGGMAAVQQQMQQASAYARGGNSGAAAAAPNAAPANNLMTQNVSISQEIDLDDSMSAIRGMLTSHDLLPILRSVEEDNLGKVKAGASS